MAAAQGPRAGRWSSSLSLTQQRLLPLDGVTAQVNNAAMWTVPISVLYSAGGASDSPLLRPFTTLWPASSHVTVNLPADVNASSWVILNAGHAGYYRVLYDPPVLRAIVSDLSRNASILAGTC